MLVRSYISILGYFIVSAAAFDARSNVLQALKAPHLRELPGENLLCQEVGCFGGHTDDGGGFCYMCDPRAEIETNKTTKARRRMTTCDRLVKILQHSRYARNNEKEHMILSKTGVVVQYLAEADAGLRAELGIKPEQRVDRRKLIFSRASSGPQLQPTQLSKCRRFYKVKDKKSSEDTFPDEDWPLDEKSEFWEFQDTPYDYQTGYFELTFGFAIQVVIPKPLNQFELYLELGPFWNVGPGMSLTSKYIADKARALVLGTRNQETRPQTAEIRHRIKFSVATTEKLREQFSYAIKRTSPTFIYVLGKLNPTEKQLRSLIGRISSFIGLIPLPEELHGADLTELVLPQHLGIAEFTAVAPAKTSFSSTESLRVRTLFELRKEIASKSCAVVTCAMEPRRRRQTAQVAARLKKAKAALMAHLGKDQSNFQRKVRTSMNIIYSNVLKRLQRLPVLSPAALYAFTRSGAPVGLSRECRERSYDLFQGFIANPLGKKSESEQIEDFVNFFS